MKTLVKEIDSLKQSDIKNIIDTRMNEFSNNPNHFSELCFCLLTANFNAKRSIEIQNNMSSSFSKLPLDSLAKNLKELGHRFPNARAKYIFEARKHKSNLELDRDWLVKNIKGLGMKEASHFLRNVGKTDYAIIDFHIVDLLVKHSLIERPKTLSKSKYLEVEEVLKKIGKKTNLNLAELDLYLWFLETGTVLK